jgi:1-acyl-sn-glycerol-3-phosphate acyltransferase
VVLCVSSLFTIYTEGHKEDTGSTEGERILMNILKSLIVWFIGVCFIIVSFPLTLIVWLLTLPFDRDKKLVHLFLTYASFILSYLIPIWSIHIEGREKAEKGTTYVIISNHQSILDILLLNCLRYKFKWISKIENLNVPVIGWYLRMADYIIVDRGNEESKAEMLDKSYKCLKKGISVMIFPEGTRSLNNKLGFFKRGAFQLAMQADVHLLPVLIDGTGGILPKHGMIFGSGHQIKIRVLDPVKPAAFGTDNPESLALKLSTFMALELDKLNSGRK